MQEQKKQRTTKEKNSFRRKERGVFEKSLTGPTLLEMSDYVTIRPLERARGSLRISAGSRRSFGTLGLTPAVQDEVGAGRILPLLFVVAKGVCDF